jgi:hypothetical protein
MQERLIHFSTSTGLLHYLVRGLQLHSAATVSPTWTTSHSRNISKVQRDNKGPTNKCLLTTNKISHMRCSKKLLTNSNQGYSLRNIWPKIAYIKVIHIRPMQMQSHGINMTPMSIEQRRVTLWWKSIRTQNAVKDRTGNSLTRMGQTNKHEGLHLMFVNHGKRMEYTILRQ